MSTDIKVTPSSGNVFANLSLPNPEERLVKATIALSIAELIEKRTLTLTAAHDNELWRGVLRDALTAYLHRIHSSTHSVES